MRQIYQFDWIFFFRMKLKLLVILIVIMINGYHAQINRAVRMGHIMNMNGMMLHRSNPKLLVNPFPKAAARIMAQNSFIVDPQAVPGGNTVQPQYTGVQKPNYSSFDVAKKSDEYKQSYEQSKPENEVRTDEG